MNRRILSWLLVAALCLPLMAGAVTTAKEGFPIVDERVTMTIANGQSPIQIDFNEVEILKNFEEVANIDMQYRNIPYADRATQLSLLLASGDVPDLLLKMNVSSTDQAKYAEEGIFVALSDYEEYMPNLYRWFEQFPSAKEAVTQADGKIYAAPYILAGNAIRMGTKVFFNTDVMSTLGYEKIPTTIDGLLEYLRASKKLDYNQNGQEDEIPLSAADLDNLFLPFLGSFGLANRGGAHVNVLVDNDGKLQFAWASEQYRQMLRFFNTLYMEKLIDQDIFTMDFAQLIAKVATGRVLTYNFVNNSPAAGSPYEALSLGITEPFEGSDGSKYWAPYTLPARANGEFLMTYKCKYPEAAARWIDHWYSDEGIISYFMGVEGVTYEKDAASPGGLKLTDYVLKNPDGINFEQVLAKYVPWAGGSNPSVATNEFFKGGETWPSSVASADGLINFVPETIWVPFSRYNTAEEASEMSQLLSELLTYNREWRGYFITGQKSLDNDWEAYISGYAGMQLERYMELYQKGVTLAGAN